MSHCKPPIAQNLIPLVKELCQHLEFGDAYDRPEQDLKVATQCWRKQYINYDGTRGKDLTDWRSAKTQSDLNGMARDFLRMGGYDLAYWSSKDHQDSNRILEYPRDEQTITDLLSQLFWRENVNEIHNAKHPDRGRRIRESIESEDNDRSPAAMIKASSVINSWSHNLPAQGLPRFAPSWCSASRFASKGGLGDRPEPTSNGHPISRKSNTAPRDDALTQASGSIYAPSTCETETDPSSLPSNISTSVGTAAQDTQEELQEDIFEFNGSDSEKGRQTKAPESKLVVLKYKQIRNNAAVANMLAAPSPLHSTVTKSQPRQNKATPKSKSPRSTREGCSTEPRAQRIDIDVRDGEYTPRKGAKRRRVEAESLDETHLTRSKAAQRVRSPVLGSETLSIAESVEHQDDATPPRSEYQRLLDSFVPSTKANTSSAPMDISSSPLVDNRTTSIGKAKEIEDTPATQDGQKKNLRESQSNVSRDHIDRSSLPFTFPPRKGPDKDVEPQDTASITTKIQLPPSHQTLQPLPQRSEPRQGPQPEIRYYIISRTPQWSEQHWLHGSLGEKSIEAMFDDVEKFTSKRGIEYIDFRLTASKKEVKFTIPREDAKLYEAMKKRFSARINASLAAGDAEFEIELEVDPRPGEAEKEADAVNLNPGFSF